MSKSVYVNGIRIFKPHEKAPKFVKGTVLITLNELVKFAKENAEYLRDYNGEKQLPCQLLASEDGRLSLKLDTWKPSGQKAPDAGGGEEDESLPF